MKILLCWLGFHDWRLHAYSPAPLRLIWRCERCADEILTPQTKTDRAVVDSMIPVTQQEAISGTEQG